MRKPDNGMIMQALKDFNINLKKSIFIGDKETDKLAAIKSNIKYKILQFKDRLV
jgi:histidinol phosphatase-like enzyme